MHRIYTRTYLARSTPRLSKLLWIFKHSNCKLQKKSTCLEISYVRWRSQNVNCDNKQWLDKFIITGKKFNFRHITIFSIKTYWTENYQLYLAKTWVWAVLVLFHLINRLIEPCLHMIHMHIYFTKLSSLCIIKSWHRISIIILIWLYSIICSAALQQLALKYDLRSVKLWFREDYCIRYNTVRGFTEICHQFKRLINITLLSCLMGI